MLSLQVTVHAQVWIRSAIVRIWLNFYVCCRVQRSRGAEPMILHTYRDVQEAVPYNPSYGVNCNHCNSLNTSFLLKWLIIIMYKVIIIDGFRR